MLKVRLVSSLIGVNAKHRLTVRGLGLRRVNSQSTIEDTKSNRGMINKVSYLLEVTDLDSKA